MLTSTQSLDKFQSLQHLRGIAALLVVAVHARVQLSLYDWHSNVSVALQHWGDFGVDIFFVLSGLLMVVTTAKLTSGKSAAKKFMQARLKRIVPLYWILTAVFSLTLLVFPSIFRQDRFDLMRMITSFAFITPNNTTGSSMPVIYPGWTLNYEMFFYAIFASILVFTRRHLVPVVTAVFMALALLRFIASNDHAFQFYTDSIMLEFIFGCWAGALLLRGKILPFHVSLVLAMISVTAILFLKNETLQLPRFVCFGIPAALLVFCAVSVERRRGWPSFLLLRHIGDSSYSLYLSHIFVLPVLSRLLLKPNSFRHIPADLIFVTIIAVCVVGGYIVFFCIERPISRRASFQSTLIAPIGLSATLPAKNEKFL